MKKLVKRFSDKYNSWCVFDESDLIESVFVAKFAREIEADRFIENQG